MQWLRKKPTMMVGIDVTHAGPTSRTGTPSIAAVVANVDETFVQFPASMRIQAVDENKESKEVSVRHEYKFDGLFDEFFFFFRW